MISLRHNLTLAPKQRVARLQAVLRSVMALRSARRL
jgi:hypothetical protein